MRASVDALRLALRSADISNLDKAVELVAYYIRECKPFPETVERLLAPVEGEHAFNQRLGLVRDAAGL
jgi:hypothetical protein